MTLKYKKDQLVETVGVLTNAPATPHSRGFSFVTLDDGTSVFCPKSVTKAARISSDDIGADVKVRYTRVSNGKFVAVRAYVLRGEVANDDQSIADAVVEIDDLLSGIIDRVERLYDMLDARGCSLPDLADS